MATLINFTLKGHQLPKERWIKGKSKDGKETAVMYLTVSINDEADPYGQNVAVTCSQTPEERENKVKKTYVGNGRVVWYNGNEPKVLPRKDQQETQVNKADNDFDFLDL